MFLRSSGKHSFACLHTQNLAIYSWAFFSPSKFKENGILGNTPVVTEAANGA